MRAEHDDPEYLTVARIVRPQGNRGEVVADAPGNDESIYDGEQPVWLAGAVTERKEFKVERAWRHKGRLILKFEGIDSISEAEGLRGCFVQIRRDRLKPLDDGEYYLADLIGCRVIEDASGRPLGIVKDVQEPGGPMLLEVIDEEHENEILIPFKREICVKISPEGGFIRVRMPEGLEDLNR